MQNPSARLNTHGLMEHQDQALLVAILETAVDAIIIIDAQGIIQRVNPAATKLFGYAKSEMIGENVKLLMSSPDRQQHDGYIKRYLETGRAQIIGSGREVIGRRNDGTTFPMHLAVSKFLLRDELMFAGIIRDISDIKQSELKLTQANEQLEQRVRERTEELRTTQAELLKSEKLATLGHVSGGIAHEIRNPLNAIRTSAYYLSHAKNPTPEKIDEHLQRIDRQVSLIDNVVTALSDIARLPEPALCLCDLSALLRKVIATVSIPASIDVRFCLPHDSFRASVDPNQISIVFRNLIRNARDSMAEGGRITISGKREKDALVVQVADTGIGIAEHDLGKITEPLFSTKARGMGLGLAISVAILHKNHGRLEVKSQLGKGSTFSVHLKPANEPSDQ